MATKSQFWVFTHIISWNQMKPKSARYLRMMGFSMFWEWCFGRFLKPPSSVQSAFNWWPSAPSACGDATNSVVQIAGHMYISYVQYMHYILDMHNIHQESSKIYTISHTWSAVSERKPLVSCTPPPMVLPIPIPLLFYRRAAGLLV